MIKIPDWWPLTEQNGIDWFLHVYLIYFTKHYLCQHITVVIIKTWGVSATKYKWFCSHCHAAWLPMKYYMGVFINIWPFSIDSLGYLDILLTAKRPVPRMDLHIGGPPYTSKSIAGVHLGFLVFWQHIILVDFAKFIIQRQGIRYGKICWGKGSETGSNNTQWSPFVNPG